MQEGTRVAAVVEKRMREEDREKDKKGLIILLLKKCIRMVHDHLRYGSRD